MYRSFAVSLSTGKKPTGVSETGLTLRPETLHVVWCWAGDTDRGGGERF